MMIPASGGVHESCTQSEDPLIGSFTRVYDAVVNHSSDPQLSDQDLESIEKLYENLSNVPLRDALAALHSLNDAVSKASLNTHAAVERCSESPSCEPLVHVELREWSPREHAHLPSPTQVFSAPVLSRQGAIVAKVTDTLVAKYGTRVSVREVDAMRYVSTRTSIPVPKVHGVYQHDSQVFIFMDFIHGKTLDKAWPEMTPSARSLLVDQLRDHLSHLRLLTAQYIGTLGHNPAFDTIIEDLEFENRGPFLSVASFHDTLVQSVKQRLLSRTSPEYPTTLIHGMRRILKDDFAVHFCHGHFKPCNILISDGMDLAAIISWGKAGFWPSYWEWIKANDRGWEDDAAWRDALISMLESFDREWVMYFNYCQEPFLRYD